ncbi:hypothetical protein GCM10025771_40150 [Niveibacterium umoris]
MRRLLPTLLLPLAASVSAATNERFFDDFSYADRAAFEAAGWQVRAAAGHPGVPGATWRPEAVRFKADGEASGNQLLELTAQTDGSAAGTVQAQVCQARKFLEGTYAARLRFVDVPVSGPSGDAVIQAFYAVAPLRFAFDPEFSELDWEYLPNGGWGSPQTRLYSITWQTVRIDPWLAYNQPTETAGKLAGWHVLVMQVAEGRTRWYLDGRQVATHGGRNYPVVPMSINFSLWFSEGQLLPETAGLRRYAQQIDWVFHARNSVLSPEAVLDEVSRYRQTGAARVDTVPGPTPPLPAACDI